MCLQSYTFDVKDKNFKCSGKCFLRWVWKAEHISASKPEMYENCIDVTMNGQGSGTSKYYAAPLSVGAKDSSKTLDKQTHDKTQDHAFKPKKSCE